MSPVRWRTGDQQGGALELAELEFEGTRIRWRFSQRHQPGQSTRTCAEGNYELCRPQFTSGVFAALDDTFPRLQALQFVISFLSPL